MVSEMQGLYVIIPPFAVLETSLLLVSVVVRYVDHH